MSILKKLIAPPVVATILLLTLSQVCSASLEVPSIDWDHYHQIERQRLERVFYSDNPEQYIGLYEENVPLNPNISTYPNCTDCAELSVSVCAQDALLWETGSHKPLFGKECKVNIFRSKAADMCPRCTKVLTVYDGMHYCYETHSSCSLGFYDICPMDIS